MKLNLLNKHNSITELTENSIENLSLSELFAKLGLSKEMRDKEDIIVSLSKDKIFWPSFILFSIGSWLAGFIMGYGMLGFLGTEYTAEESRYTLLIAAAISFGGLFISYFLFAKIRGMFSRMLAISLALGSEYLVVFALAGEGHSPLWAAIAAFVLLVLLAKPFADAAHQIGSSAIFCTMLIYALSSYFFYYALPIAVLCTFPMALFTLFYPMKGLDLRPLGIVFLLSPLVLSLYNYWNGEICFIADVYARIIYVSVFSFLLYLLWPDLSKNGKKFMCFVFIPVLCLGVLTSMGITASLIIMFVSYMISSRLVFTVGIMANVLFSIVFYVGLSLPSTYLSVALCGTGMLIVCTSVWIRHLMKGSEK